MSIPITVDNAVHLTELVRVRRGWITQVRWSPRGNLLAVASAEGVHLYPTVLTEAQAVVHLKDHSGPVKSLDFDSSYDNNGAWIVTASADATVRLWRTNILASYLVAVGHTNSVDAVAFSPHGTAIASGSANGQLHLHDPRKNPQTIALHGHSAEIESIAFTPDGRTLISGGRDKTVRVWDVESGEQRAVLQHDDWVREVANPDRTSVVSACKDGTINMWDIASGEKRLSIQAHERGADTVAFSSHGLLASGGRDNLVKLWNGQMSEHIATLSAHTKPVLSVAFNPDGTLLASGSGDNTVRIWGIAYNS